MKKRFKIIIPTFFALSILLFLFLFSGFETKSKVTVNLDKMTSDEDLGIYSHSKFYIEAQPELYNEILGLGESAIKDLMVDFVDHPDDDLRKHIIMNLVNTIVQQKNLTVSKQKADDSSTYYTSSSEWFDNVGKTLYEKYVGEVNAQVLKSVHSNNEIYEIEQKKIQVNNGQY